MMEVFFEKKQNNQRLKGVNYFHKDALLYRFNRDLNIPLAIILTIMEAINGLASRKSVSNIARKSIPMS